VTSERRKHPRHAVSLDCTWDGTATLSRLAELSLGGCYVDSRSQPSVGALITLTVTLNGEPTTLPGKIVNAYERMGFAVAFTGLDEPTRDRLQTFLSSTT